jgi:hypothetical protein
LQSSLQQALEQRVGEITSFAKYFFTQGHVDIQKYSIFGNFKQIIDKTADLVETRGDQALKQRMGVPIINDLRERIPSIESARFEQKMEFVNLFQQLFSTSIVDELGRSKIDKFKKNEVSKNHNTDDLSSQADLMGDVAQEIVLLQKCRAKIQKIGIGPRKEYEKVKATRELVEGEKKRVDQAKKQKNKERDDRRKDHQKKEDKMMKEAASKLEKLQEKQSAGPKLNSSPQVHFIVDEDYRPFTPVRINGKTGTIYSKDAKEEILEAINDGPKISDLKHYHSPIKPRSKNPQTREDAANLRSQPEISTTSEYSQESWELDEEDLDLPMQSSISESESTNLSSSPSSKIRRTKTSFIAVPLPFVVPVYINQASYCEVMTPARIENSMPDGSEILSMGDIKYKTFTSPNNNGQICIKTIDGCIRTVFKHQNSVDGKDVLINMLPAEMTHARSDQQFPARSGRS